MAAHMPREEANADRAADGRRRLDRAVLALMSGVSGWWRLDLVAQDGVLHPPVPTVHGVGWEDWFRDHLLAEPADISSMGRQHTEAVLLLSQIVDRLTKPSYHGTAWLQVAGDGRQLKKTTCDLREILVPVGASLAVA
jgi:hypothetical protein